MRDDKKVVCRKLYVEENKKSVITGYMVNSIRVATKQEIEETRQSNLQGKCSHNVVYDEPGYMYHSRICGVCGKLVGLI